MPENVLWKKGVSPGSLLRLTHATSPLDSFLPQKAKFCDRRYIWNPVSHLIGQKGARQLVTDSCLRVTALHLSPRSRDTAVEKVWATVSSRVSRAALKAFFQLKLWVAMSVVTHQHAGGECEGQRVWLWHGTHRHASNHGLRKSSNAKSMFCCKWLLSEVNGWRDGAVSFQWRVTGGV